MTENVYSIFSRTKVKEYVRELDKKYAKDSPFLVISVIKKSKRYTTNLIVLSKSKETQHFRFLDRSGQNFSGWIGHFRNN